MINTTEVAAKLLEVNQRRARLKTENELLRKSNVNSMVELKARCEKLSIQVNGQNHKPELFVKEIAALSADEIRAKITGLETQIASQYRPGRIIESQSSPLQTGIKTEIASVNPNLFRIG